MALSQYEKTLLNYQGGEPYKGGVYPALESGDVIDVNSIYPAALREPCRLLGHALHSVAGRIQTDCLRCGKELDTKTVMELFDAAAVSA